MRNRYSQKNETTVPSEGISWGRSKGKSNRSFLLKCNFEIACTSQNEVCGSKDHYRIPPVAQLVSSHMRRKLLGFPSQLLSHPSLHLAATFLKDNPYWQLLCNPLMLSLKSAQFLIRGSMRISWLYRKWNWTASQQITQKVKYSLTFVSEALGWNEEGKIIVFFSEINLLMF